MKRNLLDMKEIQNTLRDSGLGHVMSLERRYESALRFNKHEEAKLLKNRLDLEWNKLNRKG